MRTQRVAVSVLTLLTLAACGTETSSGSGSGDDSEGGSGIVRTEPALTDVRWTVSALTVGGKRTPAPAGAEEKARLTFGEDGSVQGSLGCNSFHGTAEVSGSGITFGPLVSTKKMCPGPEMEVERALLGVLKGTTRYEIEQNSLSIEAEDGKGLRASTPAAG
ncbi:META domain-containing protein [Streptomyces sp. NPDC051784]|uniref:META domain-containing protein n=1 Tax=Streptomyces sp. NPDC051784 TaxID=3155805 RepID=UPI0034247DA8